MTLLDSCISPNSVQSPHRTDHPRSPLITHHARARYASRERRRAQADGDWDFILLTLLQPQIFLLFITVAVTCIALCDIIYVDHNPHHPQAIYAHQLLDELPGHSQTQQSQKVRFIGGSPQGMQLFEETPQFFSAEAFAHIQAALAGNSSLLAPFGRSTGRVGTKTRTLTFNKDSIGRLKSELQYGEAAMLFERMRLPDANAWVLRLVASEACQGFKADLGVWGIHRDELSSNNAARDVFLDPVHHLVKIAPYIVNVLDVASPEMLGGEMWVWQPDGSWPSDNTPPAAVLPHRSNTLFSFRGDSYHGINGHNSTIPGPRISIELEQYKVPRHLYAQTVFWDARSATTEFRAKRPPPPPQYQPSSPEQRAAAATLLKATQAGRRGLAAVEETGKLGKPANASSIASPALEKRSPVLALNTARGQSQVAPAPAALTAIGAQPALNTSATLPALQPAPKKFSSLANATAKIPAASGGASQVQLGLPLHSISHVITRHGHAVRNASAVRHARVALHLPTVPPSGANTEHGRSTTPLLKPPLGKPTSDASGGGHGTREHTVDKASKRSTAAGQRQRSSGSGSRTAGSRKALPGENNGGKGASLGVAGVSDS